MKIVSIIRERIELKYMVFVIALLIVGIVWAGILSVSVKNNLYSTFYSRRKFRCNSYDSCY